MCETQYDWTLHVRGCVRECTVQECHSTYTIRQYSDLNELLGDRWHIRIVNSNGDFSQVLLETIRFYLGRGGPRNKAR